MSQKEQKPIYQGAEAIIYQEGDLIIKDRIAKSYRLKILDEKIRKQRTRAETKLLEKASSIINCPLPIHQIQRQNDKNNTKIIMPFIKGKKLSEHLDEMPEKQAEDACIKIGQSIAKLHDNNIIHGDLTTSNIILVEKAEEKNKIFNNKYINSKINSQKSPFINKTSKRSLALVENSNKKDEQQIWFIDFGLGFHSQRIEDKAVDLHLIKQALEAKHFQNWEEHYKNILKGYKTSINFNKVLEQLKKVEARGRYKGH